MTLGRYVFAVPVLFLSLFAIFVASRTEGYEGAGYLLTLLELVAYGVGTLTIFRNQKFRRVERAARVALGTGLALMACGDIGWAAIHYLKVYDGVAAVSIVMNLMFMTGYLGIAIGLYRFLPRRPSLGAILAPIGVTAAALAYGYHALHPAFDGTAAAAVTWAHAVLGTWIFFVTMMFFLAARSLDWTFLTAGLAIAFLDGTEVVLMGLSGIQMEFGLYEFIWAFGIILACISITFRSRVTPTDAMNTSSVTTQIRVFSLLSSGVVLGLMRGFDDQTFSLTRDSAIGMTGGVIISSVFSAFVAQRLENFTRHVSRLLDADSLAGSDPAPHQGGLPAELQHAYQTTIKAKIGLINADRRREKAELSHQLVTQIAHDIRSPVTALDMAVRKFSGTDAPFARAATACVREIRDVAAKLLETHLQKYGAFGEALEATATERAPTGLETVALTECLQATVARKKLEYSGRADIALAFVTKRFEGELSARVERAALTRVLSNLINNAYEAIDGAGHIELSLARDANGALITVGDSGHGIPPAHLDRVFTRGFTAGKTGGNGMGLSYAKQCVEQWGGRIWIESEVGRGTRVQIALPPAPSEDGRPIGPDAVLFVEDNPFIREFWQVAAADAGVEIHVFPSADALLAVLARCDAACRVYVDQDLAPGEMQGSDLVPILVKRGFNRVYIASEHEPERFARLIGVAGCVGKEPPFARPSDAGVTPSAGARRI